MAPTGGFFNPQGTMLTFRFRPLHAVMLFVAAMSRAELIAKQMYYMDKQPDCVPQGFISLPRDQTTLVYGRSSENTGIQLSCMLKFEPQNRGDKMSVTLESGAFVNTPEVTLSVTMSGAGSYMLRYLDNNVKPVLEADGGQVTIQLTRKIFTRDFYFVLRLKASQAVEGGGGSSGGDTDVGLIVGVIAGVLVALVIIAILCICCRRKRQEERNRNVKEMKQDLTKDSLNTSVGYDNNTAKNGPVSDSADESPRSDRKLLSNKPKSALERFGPSGTQRRRTLDSRGDNHDDVEAGRRRGDYEEREVRQREDRFDGPRDREPAARQNYQNQQYTRNENEYADRGRRRGDYEDQDQRRPPQDEDPRRSPLLADLQSNPRFRRSLHEANQASVGRDHRPAGQDDTVSSSASLDSSGRPKLPPVPKSPPRSPSPQRRGEKIAGIFRARPSSSGSDIVRVGEENGHREDSDEGAGASAHVSRRDAAENKGQVKHSLRPNRGERKTTREEEAAEDDKQRRRREKERREEERARRRAQEEEEEEEEEERRRKKEKEKKKRREEERRREEEEEEKEEERRRRRKEKEEEEKYEGRFKKSASGRRSKGKAPRMGRSRSTGNALEEMENQYQRSRSKSPSSVRSLNFVEDDDDDDADSNYMPFRRAGSKTSLYTSRTSLTGRRRKNSMGETMSLSSYARTDDMDSRMGDFRGSNMSHRERERLFRSTGDLEMRPASAQIVRDCATQTGDERPVYIYGKKTLATGRVGKRYSRGTQTMGRERRDSVGSAKSGRSTKSGRLKSRSKSQESLRSLRKEKRSRSRELDDFDDSDSERSRRKARSKSRDRDYSDDDDGARRRKQRSRSRDIDDDTHSKSSRSKPRSRPRKSTAASVDLSDSEGDFDDGKSGVTSSVAPSSVYAPAFQPGYGPAMMPSGYPMAYQQPGMAYLPTAPGGPPMVIGAAPPAGQQDRPPVAPKPKMSKWDQLVQMTDGEQQRPPYGADVAETESVMSSVFGGPSPPKGGQGMYAPPSYITAQRLPDPNATYSSSYPHSSGEGGRTPRDYKFSGSIYTDSVV